VVLAKKSSAKHDPDCVFTKTITFDMYNGRHSMTRTDPSERSS